MSGSGGDVRISISRGATIAEAVCRGVCYGVGASPDRGVVMVAAIQCMKCGCGGPVRYQTATGPSCNSVSCCHKSTSTRLRAMGAVRPMAVAAEEVLVLGKWCDGHYPIEWRRFRDTMTRDAEGHLVHREPIEEWRLFGFKVDRPLTRDDVLRVMAAIGARQEATT